MTATTPEPEIIKRAHPELALRHALVAEAQSLLTQAGAGFILIEEFGLDIAVFIKRRERDYARFIEVKAFVGSRGNGVGVGGSGSEGRQLDLLRHTVTELQVVDSTIRWVLGIGSLPNGRQLTKGMARYAFFASDRAKTSIEPKKMRGDTTATARQRNLRVTDFVDELITWDELSNRLGEFLLA